MCNFEAMVGRLLPDATCLFFFYLLSIYPLYASIFVSYPLIYYYYDGISCTFFFAYVLESMLPDFVNSTPLSQWD